MGDVEMKDPDADNFFLSRVVSSHKSDVKCLGVTSTGAIISGSRDETVKFWTKKAGEFHETVCFPQPKTLVVNSLAYYDDGSSGWRLFVGRKDGTIAVYASGNTEPVTVLTQHQSNVCCMYVDKKNKKLLSGSWDNNIIIWPIEDLTNPDFTAFLLTGHTLSVWALASLEDSPGYYLSGSADKTIKLWHDDNEVRTYTGHSDVVRALLVVSNDRFLSAANDATVRLWHTETGVCLAKYSSLMDEFIFSMSQVGPYVVSCGEGGHIEVWKRQDSEGELGFAHSQMINTPTASAWTSVGLPNGDFAMGGSDGRIYVFTQNEARKAPAELTSTIEMEVAARVAKELERKEKEAHQEVVIKVALDDGAPSMELRYQKGTDPAISAEKFIKDNDLPISYLNEITEYIVANIPEARTAQSKKYKPQSTQRVKVDGEEYDFAFSVTIDDGRSLMLPYNAGEDCDWAAQRFCEKHNLPMKYMAQFSKFLKSQTGGASGASSAPPDYYDPFTGGGRYVPSQSGGAGLDGADPLTGGGRYVPGGAGGAASGTATGADPYTSGGRYVPGSADPHLVPNACLPLDKKRPRGELVPLPAFYSFGVEQLSAKAVAKLKEINEKQDAFKLNPQQIAALEQLMAAAPDSFEISDVLISALDTGMQWPIEDIVVMMDLFRIALLHSSLNKYYCDLKTRGRDTQQRLCALLVSEPSDAVRIFACRAIANAFSHEEGRAMVEHEMGQLIPLVAREFVRGKVALQLAASSALANWSLLLLKQSETVSELGPREDALRALIKVLEPVSSFGDRNETAMVRILQAIVTLMWGDSQVITLAKSRNLVPIINRLKDAVVDDSGKNVARDIVEMTYAV